MHANVEDRGIKGDCTPLMEAASAGHVDIVRLLIAHGADVNAQSSSGTSFFGGCCCNSCCGPNVHVSECTKRLIFNAEKMKNIELEKNTW